MSINRLRDVAVRMRPPATSAAAAAHDVARPATTMPRRVSINRRDPEAKRQIWDLDGDICDPSDAPPPASLAASVDTFAAAPGTNIPAPAPASPAKAAHPPAKTRIIGFHADAIASEAAPRATEGPAYPAGFLVVTDGPGRGAFFVVTTRVSSIGRGEDQDIRLDFGDESISRSGHASVMYDSELGRFFLGHGNKANAIRRNDRPVLATEEIEHGDVLRIGKTMLRFHAFCGPDFSWGTKDDA